MIESNMSYELEGFIGIKSIPDFPEMEDIALPLSARSTIRSRTPHDVLILFECLNGQPPLRSSSQLIKFYSASIYM